MKSKIICVCFIIMSTITVGQTKIGTVDSEYIISLMPETTIVMNRSQAYGAKLDSSFSVKVKKYQLKVEDFKKNEKTLGVLAKQADYNEITEMEADIKKYQQNGSQLMQLKKNELMRPLYKKLSDAISVIAKAGGYSQILTITGNEFAYIDNKFDITELVIKNLGLKAPTATK